VSFVSLTLSSISCDQGVEIFWDLYVRETGCSPTSLNGQDIVDVQTKVVRALCNYEFAKYCWKVLVGPNLQELSSSPRQGERIDRRKVVNFVLPVTDWVLDGKTANRYDRIGLRNRMQSWVSFRSQVEEMSSHRTIKRRLIFR